MLSYLKCSKCFGLGTKLGAPARAMPDLNLSGVSRWDQLLQLHQLYKATLFLPVNP